MATPDGSLAKRLFTEIKKLKICNTANPRIPFLLEKSPFPDEVDDEALAEFNVRKEHLLIGRIQPSADIFNQGSYQIEIKLSKTFPADPPDVRFLTPVYHPNIGKDGRNQCLNGNADSRWSFVGQICNELLKNTSKWSPGTFLVDVVKALVEHIDKPDLDYALRPGSSPCCF